MTSRFRFSVFAASALLAICASPLAADTYKELADEIVTKVDAHPQSARIKAAHSFNASIASSSRAKQSKSQNLTSLTARFLQNDVDGTTGLTTGDSDLLLLRRKSAQRASDLARRWSQDINGDFKITEEELELYFGYESRRPIRSEGLYFAPSKQQFANILDKKIQDALRDDLNGDRVLTGDELVAAFEKRFTERYMKNSAVGIYKLFPQPELLDLDGDQSVSETEFSDYAAMILDLMDLDGDNIISRDEQRAMRYAMQKIRRASRD